jgi:hypothetical protein
VCKEATFARKFLFNENRKSMEPETKDTASDQERIADEVSNLKPRKGRIVDVTEEGLAFQFLGVKRPSDESV